MRACLQRSLFRTCPYAFVCVCVFVEQRLVPLLFATPRRGVRAFRVYCSLVVTALCLHVAPPPVSFPLPARSVLPALARALQQGRRMGTSAAQITTTKGMRTRRGRRREMTGVGKKCLEERRGGEAGGEAHGTHNSRRQEHTHSPHTCTHAHEPTQTQAHQIDVAEMSRRRERKLMLLLSHLLACLFSTIPLSSIQGTVSAHLVTESQASVGVPKAGKVSIHGARRARVSVCACILQLQVRTTLKKKSVPTPLGTASYAPYPSPAPAPPRAFLDTLPPLWSSV